MQLRRIRQVAFVAVLTGLLHQPSGNRAQSVSEAPLPGKGLAQHPFLYCGEWENRGKSDQVMRIVRGGKVVWSYAIPGNQEYGDCTLMKNGNIVFSRRLGASEITPGLAPG